MNRGDVIEVHFQNMGSSRQWNLRNISFSEISSIVCWRKKNKISIGISEAVTMGAVNYTITSFEDTWIHFMGFQLERDHV